MAGDRPVEPDMGVTRHEDRLVDIGQHSSHPVGIRYIGLFAE
jgi:hypothetical protein